MSIRNRVTIPLHKVRGTEFVSFSFEGHSREDIALLFPGWDKTAAPLVRLHSECLTGDVFGSLRCDCNNQLHAAMDEMAQSGGIILYLRQEGRDIGLYNKLDAYHLQIHQGMNTFEANKHLGFPEDARDYKIAALMLKDLGVGELRLLSNNPAKAEALRENGIIVSDIMPTGRFSNSENENYLETKKKSGHIF